MQVSRCAKCMNPAERYPCPHCGFDGSPQPSHCLPYYSILGGKYLVGRMLGQGGFGITYIGWDLALDEKIAIKEFFPNGHVLRDSSWSTQLHWTNSQQSQELQRSGAESFLREAKKMARIRSVSEATNVIDAFFENDTAYIIMEFVEGQTLKSVLEQQGPLTWTRAKEIFFPAIRAMGQIHQMGIIHRDLSPDNLMIRPDGSVKILDLGAAKDMTVNSGASSMLVAKGGFSPLEQYTQRGGSGAWTDVYAMAATMYYSITGVMPPAVMDRMEEDRLDWQLPQLRALPAGAVNALRHAMEVYSKNRTQSMEQFLLELQTAPVKRTVSKGLIAAIAIPAAAIAIALGLYFSFFAGNKDTVVSPPAVSANHPGSGSHVPGADPAQTEPETVAPVEKAYSGTCGEELSWVLEDNTLVITGSGKMDNFRKGTAPWFGVREEIKRIWLPEEITGLGEYAFYGLPNIKTLVLPDSIHTVPEGAMESCKNLAAISTPELDWDHSFFSGPYGIYSREWWEYPEPAFSLVRGQVYPCGSNLCWSIDEAGVLNISGSGQMSVYETEQGWKAYGKEITAIVIEPGVTSVADSAFQYCYASSVSLPNTLTSIGFNAFSDCLYLREVVIPEGVVEVDIQAVSFCFSLERLVLPASLSRLNGDSFTYNYYLEQFEISEQNPFFCVEDGVLFSKDRTKLVAYPSGRAGSYQIPGGVQVIGEGTFISADCLEALTIPEGVTTIESWGLSGCNRLSELTLPDSLLEIQDYALGNICVDSLNIPKNVTSLGNCAFSHCSVNRFTVDPENPILTAVDGVLFSKDMSTLIRFPANGASSYTVPAGVTVLRENAFSDCYELSSVTLPDSLVSIESWAFSYCGNLRSVNIPQSVSYIGWYAFDGCEQLKSVTISRNCLVEEDAFPEYISVSYY